MCHHIFIMNRNISHNGPEVTKESKISLSEACMPRSLTSRVDIPARECHLSFVTSSGPGGQNVNKVASRAVLKWYPLESEHLSERQREKLLRALRPRERDVAEGTPVDELLSEAEFKAFSPAMKRLRSITSKEGAVVLQESESRDQLTNRRRALEKLNTLVNEALEEAPVRKKVKPGHATKARQRADREHHSKKKQERSRNRRGEY